MTRRISFAACMGAVVCTAMPSMAQPPALHVVVSRGRHPISPDIYGVNHYSADPGFLASVPVTVQRAGGNAATRYNWQVDSSNAGHDFFYIGGSDDDAAALVPGKSIDDMVSFDKQRGMKSVVTVPILGLVNRYHEHSCSYWDTDYPEYGPQWGAFPICPWVEDSVSDAPRVHGCGSGLDPAHEFWEDVQLDAKHPLSNHVAVDPTWMSGWLRHLVGTHGSARRGGATIYQLDNEPESWSYIHHDVHPSATGFDEVLDKSVAYASMIKRVDGSAQVLGPSNWGVPAYYDMGNESDGAASHGSDWYAYYLTQMRAAEASSGKRLLDYFDQHFYPMSDGFEIANAEAGDAATQAARLRATRALWDPSYLQENWMGTFFPDSFGVAMIVPRLRAWTRDHYPGTRTSITEYNFGGLEHINGALAQADVLGIFGREGLDLATLWLPPLATDPGAFAFRMYLDYDGRGAKFGDVAVEAQSDDQGALAVYAAERRSDGALTLLVVNKTDAAISTRLTIADYLPESRTARVFSYDASDITRIVGRAAARLVRVVGVGQRGVPDFAVDTAFAASSITLIEVAGHSIPGLLEDLRALIHAPGKGRPDRGFLARALPHWFEQRAALRKYRQRAVR